MGHRQRCSPLTAIPPRLAPRFCRYVGTDSVYTLTTPYERDEKCPICSAGVSFEVAPATTLQQVGSRPARSLAACPAARTQRAAGLLQRAGGWVVPPRFRLQQRGWRMHAALQNSR